jgi:hypothetical protein
MDGFLVKRLLIDSQKPRRVKRNGVFSATFLFPTFFWLTDKLLLR